MKTYRYILIDKNKMNVMKHFSTKSQLADFIYRKVNFHDMIIIKNEEILIDLTSLNDIDKDSNSINKAFYKLRELL